MSERKESNQKRVDFSIQRAATKNEKIADILNNHKNISKSPEQSQSTNNLDTKKEG